MSEEDQEPQTEITTPPEPETVEIEVESAETPAETQEPPKTEEKKPFDPKKDKVAFDKPEQQERFNEVFRQLKKSDQRNEMLTRILEDAVKSLEELKQERSEAKEADVEKSLLQKLTAAKDNGDDEAYNQALKSLIDFSAAKGAEKIIEKKVNASFQNKQPSWDDAALIVTAAMEETDTEGNYIRPWLQEDDPNFGIALYKMQRIAKQFEGDPAALQKTLAQLDQEMVNAVTKKDPPKEQPPQTRAPNPMQGSNLTNRQPKGTIKMTRKELDIVRKLEQHSGRKIDLKKFAARRDSLLGKGGR